MTLHRKQVEYELFITRWGYCAANKANATGCRGLRPLIHFVLSCSGPYPHLTMIFKQLKMEGFMQSRWEHKHPESLMRLMGWLKEVSILCIFHLSVEHFLLFMYLFFLQGKLQSREHVTKGFEQMPTAFMGMLHGENIGKAIVAV